jgi:uncharacterized protein
MIEVGPERQRFTLQPVSGKAIPVFRGEVLRIAQVVGEQCVDFNCFNLRDYGERMSVAEMRQQGIRPRQGHLVASAPPRSRPMMAIVHMAETCVTDLVGARCDATLGEREYGIVDRTNCQDSLAEAIREYGLTPDDVHDSFNLWMHTIWDTTFRPLRNIGPPGDHVDLLALMDVLAVMATCGSGDLGQVSNFSLKPIEVAVFERSDASTALMDEYLTRCTGLKGQRSRATFRNSTIRTQVGLEAHDQPQYRPVFPIRYTEVPVDFSADEYGALIRLRGEIGATDEEVVRSAFMLWYRGSRARPHWLRP